jgi:hypothetical protein
VAEAGSFEEDVEDDVEIETFNWVYYEYIIEERDGGRPINGRMGDKVGDVVATKLALDSWWDRKS